jgi:hypothetical protein
LGVNHYGAIMTNTERLEKILNSTRLRENSKPFISSMLEQAKKCDLSEKQVGYINKFWADCFPPQEILDSENEWVSSFTPEMKQNITIIGEYYSHHYSNSKIAKNYKDPNWIPDKQLYKKAVGTQYAKITINNYNKPFRFNVGDTVVLRDTQINRSLYNNLDMMKDNFLVLEQRKEAKNNFVLVYKVISIEKMDEQKTFLVKESDLNVLKNKKVKNG